MVSPTITAAVTAGGPPSASGWYAAPVTVSFTCQPQSAPLAGPCPSPVVLDSSGADQVAQATITATDGGTASTQLVVDVDLDVPSAFVNGIRDGRTYRGEEPTARCVAVDTTSAIDSCVLTSARNGRQVTVTATATDQAGNVGAMTVTYRVPLVQVLDARFNGRQYVVRRGQPFEVRAVLGSSASPRLLGPVRRNDTLRGAGRLMRAAESQDGVTLWERRAKIGNRTQGKKWKVGVLVGGTTSVIKLKVRNGG